MATLAGLTTGILKRIIRRGYSLDISGAATLREIRAKYGQISANRFYDLRREVLASTPYEFKSFFRGSTKPLPHRQHIYTKDPSPTKYKYVIEIGARSSLTGEPYNITTALYYNRSLGEGEIREIVSRLFLDPTEVNRLQYEQGVLQEILTIQAFRTK